MTKHLCILPWIHLSAHPTGEVKPCCLYEGFVNDKDDKEIHLTNSTLSDAWESQSLNNLRSEFLGGKKPVGCRPCWVLESEGKQSKRMIDNQRFSHHFDNLEKDTKPSIKYLDIKLGNICNLKCRICNSYNSSAWAKEEGAEKQEHVISNLKKGRWAEDNEDFWYDLSNHIIPNLEFIDFAGGEPLLSSKHDKLLNLCIQKDYAKNIGIHYNTNGTIYNENLVNNIWPKFKYVEVMLSIDDIGKRFEYQRFPALWEEVSKNILKFKGFKNLHVTLNLTPNIMNIWNLDEFIDWAVENNLEYNLNPLYYPEYFNFNIIPNQLKDKIITKLASYTNPDRFEHHYHKRMATELTGMLKLMKSQDLSEKYLSLFFKMIEKYDQTRNQSFQEYFRDWAQELYQYKKDL